MHSHPNARLTQKSRLRVVNQHLQERRPLADLAAEAGISLRCAYKSLARYRSGGAASLADRRSVRRTQRRTLDPQQQQHAVELRHQRLHLPHIPRMLGAPFSTVARALNRLGLGRLRNLEPKPPVLRYERDHPGDLIHIDVESLTAFARSVIASPATASRAALLESATTLSTWGFLNKARLPALQWIPAPFGVKMCANGPN